MTELLFREDSYAKHCHARVVRFEPPSTVVLDRTVFFARSGGQQGDRGTLLQQGKTFAVEDCVYAQDKYAQDKYTQDKYVQDKNVQDKNILHILEQPPENPDDLKEGSAVEGTLDWRRRYAMMRLHTALHLLCSLVPYGVSGGNIATEKARLDFDCGGDALDKETLQRQLNQLIEDDRSVSVRWEEEGMLRQNPQLVRTLSVQPPKGEGRVRLVAIEDCDLQPCGGTHVGSTAEVGRVLVGKIENKGKHNRRITLRLQEELEKSLGGSAETRTTI